MSDIPEYIQYLKTWKSQAETRKIEDILLRISKMNPKQEQEEDLSKLVDTLTQFHKQINKEKKIKVNNAWFKQVQTAKKHVRKILDDFKKKRDQLSQPKLIKTNSEISYPKELFSQNDDQRQKQFIKVLYRSFLLNMEQKITEKVKDISDFLNKVLSWICEQFDVSFQKKGNSQQTIKAMMNRVNAVSQKLSEVNSTFAKKEMLEGKKQAKDVARLQEEAFEGSELKKIREERLAALVKESQVGYYDEMKKNLNKDANEECPACHKNAAYCEDMKQIRASDQPMTRFMLCNNCGERWRQQ